MRHSLYTPFCFRTKRSWYATGGMRWSTIEEKHGLFIHTWSVDDACQLMRQHEHRFHHNDTMKLHNPDQPQRTLGIARQQGAANSRSKTGIFRTPPAIQLHIPSADFTKIPIPGIDTLYSTYSARWGAPPAEQLLSPQAWSELLGEMSLHWRGVDKLCLCWKTYCPISVECFLEALLWEDTQCHLKHLLKEQEGGWRDVKVYSGNIASGELCEWTRRYTRQRVHS